MSPDAEREGLQTALGDLFCCSCELLRSAGIVQCSVRRNRVSRPSIHQLLAPLSAVHAARVFSAVGSVMASACSLLLSVCLTVPVNAQPVVELGPLKAPVGGSTSDRFGTAVEWQPDFFAVGAPGWRSPSSTGVPQDLAGAVHIYNRGPLGGFIYANTLVAGSGAGAGDAYGQALSSTPDWLVVGAPSTDVTGLTGSLQLQAGVAWIWSWDGTMWQSMGSVQHHDPRSIDTFGAALSVWHDSDPIVGLPPELAVGAPLDNEPTNNCGSVTIFELSSTTSMFEKTAFIAAPVLPGASGYSAMDGLFGCSVILERDLLIVGAKRRTLSDSNQGLVFVFRRNAAGAPIMPSPPAWGPWKLMQVLPSETPIVLEEFGSSLDLYGRVLAVGAPGGSTSPGSVNVFLQDAVTGDFDPTHRMVGVGGGDTGDQFGAAVQINSGWCYIGAPGYDSGSGASSVADRGVVYEFRWTPSAALWELTRVLHPPNPSSFPTVSMNSPDAGMGTSLALGSGQVVVGAPKGNNALPSQGLVMVYEGEQGTCYGDVNGDGNVSSPDISRLFALWGSTEQFADLNNDGVVSGLDLIVLLALYGPCDL